eukprot:TRINITY_DN5619_c0_g2_i2.p1 TRINITY_DN5619_c0_g2~~TRINITY_DN5619_c0_g2_i2.p1  ORF type:complete len:444 (+),score=85.70 TRINITY_DN5619_c0_g2_i2:342-1673(+)
MHHQESGSVISISSKTSKDVGVRIHSRYSTRAVGGADENKDVTGKDKIASKTTRGAFADITNKLPSNANGLKAKNPTKMSTVTTASAASSQLPPLAAKKVSVNETVSIIPEHILPSAREAQASKGLKKPDVKIVRTSSISETYLVGEGGHKSTAEDPMVIDSEHGEVIAEAIRGEVEDIDEEDRYEPSSCFEYVEDIMLYLRKQEIDCAIDSDYLTMHTDLNPRMRGVLVDWMQEVVTRFKLLIETFMLSVNMVDHYLSKVGKPVTRDQLQLIAATALFTSAKFEEIYPPVAKDFIFICEESFTMEELFTMERDMLSTLKFNVTVPTPVHFLRRFSKAARSDARMHNLSKYLSELAQPEYTMLKFKPSMIAAAAVYLTRKMTASVPIWTATLVKYTEYEEKDIMQCVKELNELVRRAQAKSLSFKATFEKYKEMKTYTVSTNP